MMVGAEMMVGDSMVVTRNKTCGHNFIFFGSIYVRLGDRNHLLHYDCITPSA